MDLIWIWKWKLGNGKWKLGLELELLLECHTDGKLVVQKKHRTDIVLCDDDKQKTCNERGTRPDETRRDVILENTHSLSLSKGLVNLQH